MNFKRFFSFLIVFIIFVSLFSFTSFAEEYDAKIEIEQALETAISYSKTVSNLKGTLEIITNNLTNKRMESLTIVNVSALIITSISGLYGMNVRLPFSNLSNVFYYIILVSIILSCSFGFYLKQKFSEKR